MKYRNHKSVPKRGSRPGLHRFTPRLTRFYTVLTAMTLERDHQTHNKLDFVDPLSKLGVIQAAVFQDGGR